MFRALISPVLRSTRLCLLLVVKCTDGAAGWWHVASRQLIEIINKLLLFHLVDCLHFLVKQKFVGIVDNTCI